MNIIDVEVEVSVTKLSELSELIGSVPTTTYGENIGVMAVTKVYSVQVIAGARLFRVDCLLLCR